MNVLATAPILFNSAASHLKRCCLLIALGLASAGCNPTRETADVHSKQRQPVASVSPAGAASKNATPKALFESGHHAEAIERFSQRDSSKADAASRIRFCDRVGLRQSGNRLVRDSLLSSIPQLKHLVGITHPTRPGVDFADKPDIGDRATVNRYGLLNILYALQMHGDACGAIDQARTCEQFRRGDPETLATIAWLLSRCQRNEDLAKLFKDLPRECRRFPSYWVAAGNLAVHHTSHDAPFSKREAADFYRMALRLEPNHLEACRAAESVLHDSAEVSLRAKLSDTAEHILTIQSLVNDIAGQSVDPSRLIGKLAETLNQSGRPIESIGWQMLYVSQTSASNTQLPQLEAARTSLLRRFEDGYDWNQILGPLDQEATHALADRLVHSITIEAEQSASAKPIRNSSERSPSQTRLRLRDVSESAGVRFTWKNHDQPREKHFRLFEPLGGGAVVTDFDRDGKVDLFLVQAGGDPHKTPSKQSDRLFRNQSRGTIRFADVSQSCGINESAYGHGATAGDWNQDGWEDIVVGNIGSNQIWINQGDGTFQPGPMLKQGGDTVTLSLAMADVHGDALPEVIEVNYVADKNVFEAIRFAEDGAPINLPAPTHFQPGSDRIHQCLPNGSVFTHELSEASTGMGVVVTDLLGNGSNEIFITNDQMANQLWSLSEGEAFLDTATIRGLAFGSSGRPLASMGVAVDDFDANGLADLHVTNFSDEWSNHYLQQRPGQFADRSVASGIADATAAMVGFGCQAVDLNNDSFSELIIANGHIEDFDDPTKPFRMPTQVLRLAPTGKYAEVSDLGDSYWSDSHLGRAVAIADFDADRRTDVVITDALEPTRIFRNESDPVGNQLSVAMVGSESERSAIGTKVVVRSSQKETAALVIGGGGYLGRNEPVIRFGGFDGLVDVTITWPTRVGADGRYVQTFSGLPATANLLVVEGEEEPWFFEEKQQ